MSVMYNPESSCFTMVANDLITNKNISHGAFRVACYLRSKPNEWNINNKDIQNQLGINQNHTLAKYWKELLSAGVIHRRKCKSEAGRFSGGYDYVIGRKPDGWDDHAVDNPHCGKDKMCKTHTHIKTDLSNTDLSNITNTTDHDTSLQSVIPQTSNKFDVVCTNIEKSTESEKTKVANEKPTKESAYLASKAAKQKPEKQKATTTPKKALFASQIDNRSHPFTLAALRALECEIEANAAHNIWVDSKTHRPMVQIAVLDDIEENLQALGEAVEDVNDGDSPVEAACIAVIDFYKDRGMNRKRPVDLSFLSGIGMADSPEGFVDWFGKAIYC